MKAIRLLAGSLALGLCALTTTPAARAADLTPDPLRFADLADVAPGATVLSRTVTLTGTNAVAPISIRGTGAAYSIDGGRFTRDPGSVAPGARVRLRLVASLEAGAEARAVLAVGEGTATWRVTTRPATMPNPFQFTDVDGAAPRTRVLSEPLRIDGQTVSSPITIRSGKYSINGAPFTMDAGRVQPGDRVRIYTRAFAGFGEQRVVRVTIGGRVDEWRVTTRRPAGLTGFLLNTDPAAALSVLFVSGDGETLIAPQLEKLAGGGAELTATVVAWRSGEDENVARIAIDGARRPVAIRLLSGASLEIAYDDAGGMMTITTRQGDAPASVESHPIPPALARPGDLSKAATATAVHNLEEVTTAWGELVARTAALAETLENTEIALSLDGLMDIALAAIDGEAAPQAALATDAAADVVVAAMDLGRRTLHLGACVAGADSYCSLPNVVAEQPQVAGLPALGLGYYGGDTAPETLEETVARLTRERLAYAFDEGAPAPTRADCEAGADPASCAAAFDDAPDFPTTDRSIGTVLGDCMSAEERAAQPDYVCGPPGSGVGLLLETTEGVPVSSTLPVNAPYDQDLSYALAYGPFNGTVTITDSPDGAFTYTPNPGYVGSDNFGFTATNAYGTSGQIQVDIEVGPNPYAGCTQSRSNFDYYVNCPTFSEELNASAAYATPENFGYRRFEDSPGAGPSELSNWWRIWIRNGVWDYSWVDTTTFSDGTRTRFESMVAYYATVNGVASGTHTIRDYVMENGQEASYNTIIECSAGATSHRRTTYKRVGFTTSNRVEQTVPGTEPCPTVEKAGALGAQFFKVQVTPDAARQSAAYQRWVSGN